MEADEARQIFAEAELICSSAEIDSAIVRLAGEITARLEDAHPLVLTVMGGAVVFAGQLLPKLPFPLECDYVHATRYGNTTSGSELAWLAQPRMSVAGRTVLVLDDILDEGITLAAIKARLLQQGAIACFVAVLAEKELGKAKPIAADFSGVKVPNRYVFGCGMDVRGSWRNLPAIFALKEGP
ncbi:MAG: hypoxanthine-guanine phosphoribosyltransferase [Sterolibacterium sp.]|jgi:hypoxanthine phosphoribosyltransferase